MKDLCLYILMRTDLPSMGQGRATAQASHASNAFIHKYGCRDLVREWQRQTKQGFGTAIVLSVNREQMEELVDSATDVGVPRGRVVDPDYVFTMNREQFDLVDEQKINYRAFDEIDPMKVLVSKQEVTCAYIFIDRNQVEDKIPTLSQLQLYPA